MKKIIERYMSIIPDTGQTKNTVFENNIYCLDKEKPNTPYIKVRITLIEYESKFDHERKNKRLFKRRKHEKTRSH